MTPWEGKEPISLCLHELCLWGDETLPGEPQKSPLVAHSNHLRQMHDAEPSPESSPPAGTFSLQLLQGSQNRL